MRLHWSEPALQDLEDIFLYLAPRNRRAAGRVVERIVSLANDILIPSPHAGRPGRIEGTRELIVTRTPYIVAYSVAAERIEVLAVLHAARDWAARVREIGCAATDALAAAGRVGSSSPDYGGAPVGPPGRR
jgi:toxin ParE1/3/4